MTVGRLKRSIALRCTYPHLKHSAVPEIAVQLAQARKLLLDLSTRNRLLNIPQQVRSKLVKVHAASSSEALRVLSGEGRKMVFRGDIVLGFFSFAKFLMYRDLDPDTWPDGKPLLGNGLVQRLLGYGFPALERLFAEDSDLDDTGTPFIPKSAPPDSSSTSLWSIQGCRAATCLVSSVTEPPITRPARPVNGTVNDRRSLKTMGGQSTGFGVPTGSKSLTSSFGRFWPQS